MKFPKPDQRRRLLTPLNACGLTSRQRRQIVGAFLPLLIGLTFLAVPVSVIARWGWVTEGEARLVPIASLAVGLAVLAIGVVCAGQAAGSAAVPRVGQLLLAGLSLAIFGPFLRRVYQFAAAHGFYVSGGASSPPLVRYWGLTILLGATFAAVLAASAGLAAAWPRVLFPMKRRHFLQRIAGRVMWPAAPLLAELGVVVTNRLLPPRLSQALGVTAPSTLGGRVNIPIQSLDATMWQSLAPLLFLLLGVGMWEGMESARACAEVADHRHLTLTLRNPSHRKVVAVLLLTAGVSLALVGGHWLLVVGAVALTSACFFALVHRESPISIASVSTISKRLGLSTDWRNAGSIGLVLAVIVLPVVGPLGYDLWNGIRSPVALIADARGYVKYWASPRIAHLPSVSISGIFGHGESIVAETSLALWVMLTIGMILKFFLGRDRGDGKDYISFSWFLMRVGLTALALIPILQTANSVTTCLILCGCAIPSILLSHRGEQQKTNARLAPSGVLERFTLASLLLAAWAVIVWHYYWLSASGVLALTVGWRFLVRAGELNEFEPLVRTRRSLGLLALALFGAGLLILGRGGQSGVLPFGDVTDRIAVSVIAPIWLIATVLIYRPTDERESVTGAGGVHERG